MAFRTQSRRPARRSWSGALLAVALCHAMGCSGGDGNQGHGGAPATPDPVDTSPLTSTGTIAYVKGNELHLVEPDGSNDHVVWAAPAVQGGSYLVTAPSWRPDGTEIAFASDHEKALSPFDGDVYAIRPDGRALRKLTNGPTRARQLTFATGTVQVSVSNPTTSSGPYWMIVLGGDVQMDTIPPGATKTYTFRDVADLGDGLQPVVVAAGLTRFFGMAGADVKPGQTVDAGLISLSGGLRYGTRDPFWRSDASRVGYFSGQCILETTAAVPPPGWAYHPLFPTEPFFGTCRGEWGPTAAASELLLLDSSRGDGYFDVLRVQEGATAKPAPVASFRGYETAAGVHWVPDGSGFYVAAQTGLVEPMQIFRYTFATGETTQVSHVELGYDTLRRFSVSPDERHIVFERTDDSFEVLATRTDLWIMDRDGSNPRLLATGGRQPAWNPTRP